MDMAEEMVKYAKVNIPSQVVISMLSQASPVNTGALNTGHSLYTSSAAKDFHGAHT